MTLNRALIASSNSIDRDDQDLAEHLSTLVWEVRPTTTKALERGRDTVDRQTLVVGDIAAIRVGSHAHPSSIVQGELTLRTLIWVACWWISTE